MIDTSLGSYDRILDRSEGRPTALASTLSIWPLEFHRSRPVEPRMRRLKGILVGARNDERSSSLFESFCLSAVVWDGDMMTWINRSKWRSVADYSRTEDAR